MRKKIKKSRENLIGFGLCIVYCTVVYLSTVNKCSSRDFNWVSTTLPSPPLHWITFSCIYKDISLIQTNDKNA